MPEFILGARGHDFGRHDPETLFSSIGQAGFACTQLAFTKAVESVKSYADVTPALVERARAAAAASGVGIAVDGTYVELSYADEDKRRAEVAKVLSQILLPGRWGRLHGQRDHQHGQATRCDPERGTGSAPVQSG